ncbi:MAG: hypothetical protein ABJL11_09865 [Parasphingorhabdus sp.]
MPENMWLETLYFVIDLGFLISLIGFLLFVSSKISVIGLLGGILAFAGVSSIVGPDTIMFELDWYQIGSAIFVLGLAILGIELVRRHLFLATGAFWIASAISGTVSVIFDSPLFFQFAGFFVGTGFIFAGFGIQKALSDDMVVLTHDEK